MFIKGQAILFTGVNQVDVAQMAVPPPAADEVVVETVYTCISPGTELRCLSGRQPQAAPFPFIPGYASVGRVIAVGEDVSLPVGTPVFAGGTHHADFNLMWGGHISHVVKPAAQVIVIPPGLDLLDAALGKMAAISYHGLRLSRPLPHETVFVAGLGVVGQLSARLHALSGARVCAFDVSDGRVHLAQQAGIAAYPLQGSMSTTARQVSAEGADILVDATGVASVLAELVMLGRDVPWSDERVAGARCLIQGSYAADVPLPYQAAFMKEITFFIPRDSQPRDLVAVLSLMGRGLLRVRDLISRVETPQNATKTYQDLQAGTLLTAVFRWADA